MLIRKKLPMAIILLISIPLILLSFIIYLTSSDFLKSKGINQIAQAIKIEKEGLRTWVNAQNKEVQHIAHEKSITDLLNRRKQDDSDDFFLTPQVEEVSQILKERVNDVVELQTSIVIDTKGLVIASNDKTAMKVDVRDREYFISALQGNRYLSNMLIAKNNGQNVVVAAAPLKNEKEEIIGVLANVIDIYQIKKFVDNVSIDKTGYAYLVDSQGIILAHRDETRLGTAVENDDIKGVVFGSRKGQELQNGQGEYIYRGVKKYMQYAQIPGTEWILVVAQNSDEIDESARALLYIIVVATLLALAVGTIISIKFSRSITNPITELMETMGNAAKGDLTIKSDFSSSCEFGQLSQSFNIMMEKLHLSHEELTAVYEELSATEEELRAQYDELQQNEEALRNSDERYKLALEGANDVIWEWNLQTWEFFASDKWTEVTGYPTIKKVRLKMMLKAIIHPDDTEQALKDFRAHIDGLTPFYKSEFRIKGKSGEYKWVFNRGKVLINSEGKPVKLAGSLTDISERKNAEEKIKFMAYYDSLTGLPNRALFIEALSEDIKKCNGSGKQGAVLFIDLDDFKKVNDTLGHDSGDQLLKQIAARLALIKREDDLICRFSGDEFLILQSGVENRSEVIRLANEALNIFSTPFILNGNQMYMTGSMGVTIYPADGDDAVSILKNADTAMYKAKESGKNKYEIYSREMYDGLDRKSKIEMVLRNSIKNNELFLYYQPQVEVKTGKIAGFEVLLRLINSELGVIPTDEFIAIAEETGLIIGLGEWVLYKACLQNMAWKEKGYEYDYIAVNISAVQLQQPDFLDMVKRVLSETGLPPEALELEITESIIMKSLDSNIRILNELRSMGIRVALDDFGTGYSSLNYLRRIPIDTLKVDKSFIDGICLSDTEKAIADGIIQMAHKMNLEVVAEGVEYESQLEVLSDKDCNKVQGYLFSRPVPANDTEEILKKGNYKITNLRKKDA